MAIYCSQDRLTQRLLALGFSIDDYTVRGTSYVIGGQIEMRSSVLAYRLDEATNTVVIIYYKRTSTRLGLKSAFSDLVWFIDLIAKPELNIEMVKGLVRPYLADHGGLSAVRIERYYRRVLGGAIVEVDDENEAWIGVSLKNYRAWCFKKCSD